MIVRVPRTTWPETPLAPASDLKGSEKDEMDEW